MTSNGRRRRGCYEYTLDSVVMMISISRMKQMHRDGAQLMMLCASFHVPDCWWEEKRLKIVGEEGCLTWSEPVQNYAHDGSNDTRLLHSSNQPHHKLLISVYQVIAFPFTDLPICILFSLLDGQFLFLFKINKSQASKCESEEWKSISTKI